MDTLHSHLSQNLIFLRESMSLSRQALAEVIGTSTGLIGKLENGKTKAPSYYVIVNLSRFFGVDCHSLVDSDLTHLDRKQQAVKRMYDVYTEDQWDSLIQFVEIETTKQASNGTYRIGDKIK